MDMNIPTKQQLLEALDAMDDYARMDTGVDPIGPREVLRRFIESLPEQGEAVSDLRSLAHELEGIAADVDAGNGFDHVCRRTLQRVIDALLTTPQPAPEDRRDAALKHCEQVFMSYEINRVDGEEIADRALSIIRAAIISEKS